MLKNCLIKVGEIVLMKAYQLCAKIEDRQLYDYWYNAYVEKSRRPRKSGVNLVSLQPTKVSETQHILRSYHQIHEWLRLNLWLELFECTSRKFKFLRVHCLKPI